MSIQTVLIVNCRDDDRRAIAQSLTPQGRDVAHITGLDAAGRYLMTHPCDALILDATLLDSPACRDVNDLRRVLPELPIILAGPPRDASMFAMALRLSACGYLTCPVGADDARRLFEQIEAHLRLVRKNRFLWDELERTYGCDGLVASDPAMVDVLHQATRVAQSDAAVLIQGEEGTEKELVAQYIHRSSPAGAQPFIRMNCRGISSQQCARELFGWETPEGKTPGRIELAAGGTIYLREVDELPLLLQARLLRVLEEGQYEREDGIHTLSGCPRVIASTSCDPYQKIQRGELREDLFFRLNLVTLFLPPLRKQPGNVHALADHYARKYGAAQHALPLGGAQKTAQPQDYAWPGDVSELEGEMLMAALRGPKRMGS